MTSNDKELLSAILEIRLSERAVMSVSSNTSTQKCEAFNRGVLSSLPKEVNYSRNFAGRLASKTLQLNNSLQSAVETKVNKITGKTLSEQSRRYLRSFHHGQKEEVQCRNLQLLKQSAEKTGPAWSMPIIQPDQGPLQLPQTTSTVKASLTIRTLKYNNYKWDLKKKRKKKKEKKRKK
jgi:hypothetical protein